MKNNKDISVINEKLQQELPFLSERYKVKSLGIFGSYIRKKQAKRSDLDLLIDFNEIPSLLKFIELENYLNEFLLQRLNSRYLYDILNMLSIICKCQLS